MNRLRPMFISALIASTIGADAFAQEQSEAISLAERALSSGSFEDREAAMTRLLEDISISDADLLQLCLNSNSPEVRRRALTLHRTRFFSSARPAIGVTFASAGGLPMIERIHDGFPAAMDGSLQRGDIIVAVAGKTLNPMPSLARDELRPLIFSHNPFESVELVVYRPQNEQAQARLVAEVGGMNGLPNAGFTLTECPEGYDTITTMVQLGEWTMLDTNTPMSESDRNRAWNALLQRLGVDLSPELVVRDGSDPRNVTFHGRRIQSLDIRFPFLGRGAFFPSDENPSGFRNQAVIAKQIHNLQIQQAQIRGGVLVVADGNGQVVVEQVTASETTSPEPDTEALALVAREIASTRERIIELSRIAAEPGTPAAERRVAEETIAQLREQLRMLRQQLAQQAS